MDRAAAAVVLADAVVRAAVLPRAPVTLGGIDCFSRASPVLEGGAAASVVVVGGGARRLVRG